MLMRSVPDQNAAQKSIVIPGKLAIASATRNPGILRILDAGFHRHDEKHHYIRSTSSITTVSGASRLFSCYPRRFFAFGSE